LEQVSVGPGRFPGYPGKEKDLPWSSPPLIRSSNNYQKVTLIPTGFCCVPVKDHSAHACCDRNPFVVSPGGAFALSQGVHTRRVMLSTFTARAVPAGTPPGIRSSKNYQQVTLIQTRLSCISAKVPLPACSLARIVPLLFLRNNSPLFFSPPPFLVSVPALLARKMGGLRGGIRSLIRSSGTKRTLTTEYCPLNTGH